MTTYADALRYGTAKRIQDSRFRLGDAGNIVWAIAHTFKHQWTLAVKAQDVPQMSLIDIWDASQAYLADHRWLGFDNMVPNIRHDRDAWVYTHQTDKVRAKVCSNGFIDIYMLGLDGPSINLDGMPGRLNLAIDPDDVGAFADDHRWTILLLIAHSLDHFGGCSGAANLVNASMPRDA